MNGIDTVSEAISGGMPQLAENVRATHEITMRLASRAPFKPKKLTKKEQLERTVFLLEKRIEDAMAVLRGDAEICHCDEYED